MSQGILVAFHDEERQKMRKTRIFARDVVWSDRCAFEYGLRELTEVRRMCRDFGIDREDLGDTSCSEPSSSDPGDEDDDAHDRADVMKVGEMIEKVPDRDIPVELEPADLELVRDPGHTRSGRESRPPVRYPDYPATGRRAEKTVYRAAGVNRARNVNRTVRRNFRRKVRHLCLRAKAMLRSSLHSEMCSFKLDDEVEDFVEELVRDEAEQRRRALLTRACNREEARSEQGVEARMAEMKKVCETFEALTEPTAISTAVKNGGTVSGVHMLTSIKHVEREPKKRKYKGRLVLLGNLIKCLRTGKLLSPSGDEYGLYGSVTTLQGFRAVCARACQGALRRDNRTESRKLQCLDLASAYINAPWPETLPPHYVRLTKEQWEMAPADIRECAEAHRKKSGEEILLRMKRCLYGHPLSGHIWIEKCLSSLRKRGFVPCENDPALLERGTLLVCVYVDDIAATGADDELQELWNGLKEDFPDAVDLDSIRECTEFVGMEVRRSCTAEAESLEIVMGDYTREIISEYRKLWHVAERRKLRVKTTSVPMVNDLRNEETEQGGQAERKEPQRRVQKMIGMLLWLSRCSRPDIAFAASRLGSRVSSWSQVCEKELARIVLYLEKTANFTLKFTRVFADDPSEIEPRAHSDADLAEPRSQSGSFLFMQGPKGSFMPVSWQSKKQSLCADSSAVSETIAVHMCVRESLLLAELLKPERQKAFQVYVDNSSCLRLAVRGTSKAASVLQKAIRLRVGFLRDLREMGIIAFDYVRSAENRADALTKALPEHKLEAALRMFGIAGQLPSPARRKGEQ
jgi:hypothetical protein